MLKSIHRLSTKQFMEVMEKGRIYTSPLFVMRVYEDKKSGRSGGISAVAPKKAAATAVLRNRLRRQIYEAAAPFQKKIVPGVSVIIFAKIEAAKADFADMAADLKNLFAKARISV
jgi:ribonuclease P protein component